MPTGYTCRVQNGEITNLRDFALVCARAFGALIEMRDDPQDVPIPERLEPSDYHKKNLEKEQAKLVWLSGLTAEQMEQEAQLHYEKEVEEYREYLKEIALWRSRYEKIKTQVRDWQVPEELSRLKEFMLEQLSISIDGDCSLRLEEKKRMTGNEWYSKMLEKIDWSIGYHTKYHAEEIERTDERNNWLSTLFASLPPPETTNKEIEGD